MIDLFGVHWAGAGRIIFLPIILICIIFLIKQFWRLRHSVGQLCHPQNYSFMLKNFSLKRYACKTALLSTSLLLLFLAILQPQWGKIEQAVVQEGRDVLILLDISRSMCAKDLKPSRLDFAKLKIRNLLSKLPTERVGLILFSGASFVQCPLTADHAAFSLFLNHVDTEVISSGTTSLDKALLNALEVLSNVTERKNKLAIVFTDGEDFSINLDAAQQKALQDNLHLFALGTATPEGAPIPKFDDHGIQVGHETDAHGNIILSLLNEKTLENLCSKLHGHYYRATYDDSDIDALITQIKQYEKESFTEQHFSQYHERYPWFLAFAWICLALEWIL